MRHTPALFLAIAGPAFAAGAVTGLWFPAEAALKPTVFAKQKP